MDDNVNIPRHIAIIMDGNGRWAQSRGEKRLYGHMHGVESVRAAIRSSLRLGVRYLTLYVFSTENWGRPAEEVDGLMELLCKSIVNEAEELACQGVAVQVIGERKAMSQQVQEHLALIEQETASGDKLTLILALNYGSRQEITDAVRRLAGEVAAGRLHPEEITPEQISEALYTADYPDPDLIIRTSGECRLSNFLLWQAAYSELYFTEILWPDFDDAAFERAVAEYGRRDRRYGLVTQE